MAHSDRAGQQVGDYVLLRRLGVGSFGEVYLAEESHTYKQVAVKLLHAKLSQKEEWRTFLNEARLFRLKHPHIVQLLDLGITHEEFPFLVMEYAPNGTLRERHSKGTRVPLATVSRYVEAIASALQYAHDRRLVHRDVKPENVLLGISDQVLLSDFGVVTAAHSSGSLDATRVVGTPLYMAPEQLTGKPRPASDQYALAIMTYEWLTGTCPFSGTYLELISQHMMTSPPPLREHLPDLTVEVEAVVLTALAKDPKARFATVQAFAHALAQTAQLVPVPNAISLISLPDMPSGMVTWPAESSLSTNPVTLYRPSTTPFISAGSFTPVDEVYVADVPASALQHPLFATTPIAPSPVHTHRMRPRKNVLVLCCALLVLLIASGSILFRTVNSNAMPGVHATPASADCSSSGCQASLDWSNVNIRGAGTVFTVDDPGPDKSDTGFSYTKWLSVWEQSSDHLQVGIIENGFCGNGLYYFYELFASGNNPYKCSLVNTNDINHLVHFQVSWYTSNGGGLIVETANTPAGDGLCPVSNPCFVSDANFVRYPVNKVIYATKLSMATVTGHEVWGGEWIDNSYFTGTSWAWDDTSGSIVSGNPNQMKWHSPPMGASNLGGTLYSCVYPSGSDCVLGS